MSPGAENPQVVGRGPIAGNLKPRRVERSYHARAIDYGCPFTPYVEIDSGDRCFGGWLFNWPDGLAPASAREPATSSASYQGEQQRHSVRL
jgi:hypothetical protein